mmetsp:Transcript_13227/g.15385  ORF Transcript_13227/g.15385 Transcript_13227/m.15385 type:complete len:357 (-) Transcript_13227:23-1093(-)
MSDITNIPPNPIKDVVIDGSSLNLTDWKMAIDGKKFYVAKHMIFPTKGGTSKKIDEKLTIDNVSDNVAYNIALINSKEPFPCMGRPSTDQLFACVGWLVAFRKQLLSEMKKIVKDNYVKASKELCWDKIGDCHTFSSFNEMKNQLKDKEDKLHWQFKYHINDNVDDIVTTIKCNFNIEYRAVSDDDKERKGFIERLAKHSVYMVRKDFMKKLLWKSKAEVVVIHEGGTNNKRKLKRRRGGPRVTQFDENRHVKKNRDSVSTPISTLSNDSTCVDFIKLFGLMEGKQKGGAELLKAVLKESFDIQFDESTFEDEAAVVGLIPQTVVAVKNMGPLLIPNMYIDGDDFMEQNDGNNTKI